MEFRVDDIFSVLTALAGPFCICVAIIFLALWFQKDIRVALTRVKTVSGPGFGFGLSDSQQDATPAAPLIVAAQVAQVVDAQGTSKADAHSQGLPTVVGGTEPIPLLPGQFPTKYVLDNYMPKTAPDLRTTDRTAGLMFYWYFAWNMERIYRIIHGTQILLLSGANAAPVTRVEAFKLYEVSRSKGNKDQTYDQWAGFPISQQLMMLQDSSYVINNAGKLFLDYVRKECYPAEKPY